jgi:5-methylcytosine-specific restriction protein A
MELNGGSPIKWGSRPAWKTSPTARRTAGMPAGWTALRKRILKRDGHQCTAVVGASVGNARRCEHRATHVDHVVPVSQGGSDDEANLTSLCAWHHNRKTSSEANAARKRVSAKRTEDKHPGLLD